MLNRPYHSDPDQSVLERRHDEEAPEERAVIAGLVGASVTNSRSARNEMSVKSRIEPIAPVVTDDREDQRHDPPRANAGVDVVDRGAVRDRR